MPNVTGTVTLDQIDLLEVDGDPTSGAGVQAVNGSFAFLAAGSTPRGRAWLKTGAGNTNWTQVYGYVDTGLTSNDLTENDVQVILNREFWPTELQVPVYDGNGDLTSLTLYKSSTQTNANRLADVTITYDVNGDPATETWRIFSLADGVTVLKTVVFTYTVVSSDVTAIQKAVS